MFLKIPMSVLMFCQELPAKSEDLQKRLQDWQNEKFEQPFQLDVTRITSIDALKAAVCIPDALRVYPTSTPNSFFAGTQYEHEGTKTEALIQVDITAPSQSFLVVYSPNPTFRECLGKSLLGLLSAYQ